MKKQTSTGITTRLNYTRCDGETTEQPSLTVPNEAYSIRELLGKHTQGIMPNIGRSGHFFDHIDFDDDLGMFRPDFDLTDIDEAQKKLSELNAKIESFKAEQAALEKDEQQATETAEKEKNTDISESSDSPEEK